MPIEGTRTVAEGERELVRLLEDIGHAGLDWNEAETRFQIIDRLIVECLGWPRAEVRPEQHEGGDYTDYELGEPRAVIWEAKRVGKTFELPANPRRRIIADLRSVMSTSAEAKDAIQQVQGYCSRRGVDLAVTTNGQQIIAFLATRSDGIAPLDGNCLVIDGLSQLQIDFPKLWQSLSPQGVAENKLKQFLRLGNEEKIPQKIATQIGGYPNFRALTKIQKDLQIISELLLIDVAEWPDSAADFYARCYCKNWTLSHYSLISKRIIEARYAALFADSEAAPSIVPIKKKSLTSLLTDEVLAEALSQRPIILVGDVGVGKTAFLKNLMFADAASEFKRDLYVYVDLGSQGALAEDMRKFVLNEIEGQLQKRYHIDVYDNTFVEALYAADLDRFRHGIFSALCDENPTLYTQKRVEFLAEKLCLRDQHICRALAHLISTSKRQIIIVLDNSDQRASDVQIEAFAIAHELAKSWGALVFIAMRPQTYLQLRKGASIVADAQRVFTIAPPLLEQAIRLRLSFAVDIAEGRLIIARLQGIALDLVSFSAIARGIIHALERKDAEIRLFFGNYFSGNVADAVHAVSRFIGNPNVNERRIISMSMTLGVGNVVIRDIWLTLLYGRFMYYSPEKSQVINLFDVGSSNPTEHFLLLMLLGYLNQDGAHRNRDGFVERNLILTEMQDWGFSGAATQRALGRALSKERPLIDRAAYEGDETAAMHRYRINTTGTYYLSQWPANFSYLGAIWCDTPIFDDATKNLLVSRAGEPDEMSVRYLRATTLRNYLTDIWDRSALRPAYFSWVSHLEKGENEFATVRGYIEQQRQDRSR